MLAVAGLDAHDAWRQRGQALAHLAASRAAALPPRPPAPPPGQLARQAEARRLLDQLALPWPEVWGAAEQAAEGIHWLAMAHGLSSGLRLTGLAATPELAQAAAQALRGQQLQDRPLWQGVALTAMERAPEGLRFELAARLAGPAPVESP